MFGFPQPSIGTNNSRAAKKHRVDLRQGDVFISFLLFVREASESDDHIAGGAQLVVVTAALLVDDAALSKGDAAGRQHRYHRSDRRRHDLVDHLATAVDLGVERSA